MHHSGRHNVGRVCTHTQVTVAAVVVWSSSELVSQEREIKTTGSFFASTRRFVRVSIIFFSRVFVVFPVVT